MTNSLTRVFVLTLNLLVVLFWLVSGFHEALTSPDALGALIAKKGLVYLAFVLPAIISGAALAQRDNVWTGVAAIVGNLLAMAWWSVYGFAMPAFSRYQLLWLSFALVPLMTNLALVARRKLAIRQRAFPNATP